MLVSNGHGERNSDFFFIEFVVLRPSSCCSGLPLFSAAPDRFTVLGKSHTYILILTLTHTHTPTHLYTRMSMLTQSPENVGAPRAWPG